MTALTLALFLSGALAAGFVTGLTGFGTALVVSAFWLHFMDPIMVAPLAAMCSVASQVFSLKGVMEHFRWSAVWLLLVGALIGLPAGSWLLTYVDAGVIKLSIGLFLILYTGYLLGTKTPFRVTINNPFVDGVVGIIGGVLGGMAGLSGPAPLIWCQMRGLAKEIQRAIYQPFNMIVLGIAVVLHAMNGRVDTEVGYAFLIVLPATLIGGWAGTVAYKRLDDKKFQRIVFYLLMASGFVLLIRWFLDSGLV